jgi:TolB-like protein
LELGLTDQLTQAFASKNSMHVSKRNSTKQKKKKKRKKKKKKKGAKRGWGAIFL